MVRLFFLVSCLVFSTWTEASEKVSSCEISPPYRRHKVIAFRVSSQSGLDRITTILKTYCEIRAISDDGIRLYQQTLLIVTPEQFEALQGALLDQRRENTDQGIIPPITVVSEDLEATLEAAPRQRSGYKRRNFSTKSVGSAILQVDEEFYYRFSTFNDLVQKWSNLTHVYAAHITQEIIGQSYEGRNIIALRVGKTSPENPKRIFLNGLQHAREWIATHVPTYIAESLAASAASGDNEVALLLRNVEVVIAPLVNPDGYVYSHISRGTRLQRKNRRLAGCGAKQDDGVDLNRNWGKNFSGGENPGVAPCSPTFYGSGAFSEPETAAIRNFMKATPGIEAHIDFHSFGRLVLSPWSYTKSTEDKPPRDEENCGLGNAIADAMTKRHGLQYTLDKGSTLYIVGGTMADWVAQQNILSYTIELRPLLAEQGSGILANQGFLLPEDEILPTCEEGLEAVKTLLRFMKDSSSFSGRCSRSETSMPPSQENDGDRTNEGRSSVDIGFVLGVSFAGVLFVALVVVIFFVARRAKRRHPPVDNAGAGSVHVSAVSRSSVSADEELAGLSTDSQGDNAK